MALNPGPSCYCCRQTLPERMDLDAALDELGMLSTVTESRKQFVQERIRTQSEGATVLMGKRPLLSSTRSIPTGTASHSASYHIVHIDPKYVTGVSDIPTPVAAKIDLPQTGSEDVFLDPTCGYSNATGLAESSQKRRTRSRVMNISERNRRLRERKRSKQPYEVPGRLSHSFQESDLLSRRVREDIPESKSNSSSPVKSYASHTLPRSRSLDNLDFSSFFISDSSDRQDLDRVSRGMKNLHVSDT